MKKFLAIIAIASFAVACNGSGDKKADEVKDSLGSMVDTAASKMDKMVDTAASKMDKMVDSAAAKMDTIKSKM